MKNDIAIKKSHFLFVFILVSSMLSLTSCSLLSPVKNKPSHTYQLNTLPQYIVRGRGRSKTLLVTVTNNNPVYSTTQMAYTTKPFEIAYYSINAWIATPEQMLQPLLVQAMQDTRAFHAIVAPPFVGQYDYALNVDVMELLQYVVPCQITYVRLTLRAQLNRAATNEVMATKQFSIVEPIYGHTPYGGVLAANHAEAILLQQIARFAVRYAR